MEKGRNTVTSSELFEQFMWCLSPACAEVEQGRAWLTGQEVPAALGARSGPAGKSRGGLCWVPPATQEGTLSRGTLGAKCPPPAFCSVLGFFMRFHHYKQYLCNKQPGCGRISSGKNWEVCPHSNLTLTSEREIFLEPVWICCAGGFYLQTLVLSDASHVLVPVLRLLGVSQDPAGTGLWRDPGDTRAVTWEHWMQFLKGSPMSCSLQAFHRFPQNTNLVIDGSHSKILHLNKRPKHHKIKTSWSKILDFCWGGMKHSVVTALSVCSVSIYIKSSFSVNLEQFTLIWLI